MKFKREKRVYNPRKKRRDIIAWHVFKAIGLYQFVRLEDYRHYVHDGQCSKAPKKFIGGLVPNMRNSLRPN